jgi:hypothetical protein
MKIILLEKQIEDLITKVVINEQKVLSSYTETKPSQVYNISNSFASGQYKLTNTKSINDAMDKINTEIKDYPNNQQFIINVESSESAVPPPAGMKVGDLSRLRADEVEKFMITNVPENVKINKIDKGVQGPSWNPKKGKDWVEYKKNQYVTLSLQIIGSRTVETICNFTENMEGGVAKKENDFVGYEKTIDISKLPNGTKFKIVFSPHMMADMLVVNAGSFSESTGLVSNQSTDPYVNACVATTLVYGYRYNIPNYFPKNVVRLDKYDAIDLFEEKLGKGLRVSDLWDIFKYVIPDQQWLRPGRNEFKLIDEFLDTTVLYTFTDNATIKQTTTDDPDFWELNPRHNGSVGITVTKDESMSSVTMRVYSPVVGTVWNLGAKCL